MDISQPGFQITPPPPPDATLELEGALRVLNAPTFEWPETSRTPFQSDLKKILDAPWQAMKNENKEPLVAPPIYGSWQASRHTVETGPTLIASTPWLDELNLDPRHRAVAALGTVVVQTQQEQLMASAWDQLGEIERINQTKRQAQLGCTVNAVYHAKHFSRFSDETLLKVVASAQSRIVVEASGNTPRTMLSQRIRQSAMPDRALSAPLRRMTSASSRISRNFQASTATPISIINTLNTTASLAGRETNDDGLGLTIDKVSDDQSGPFATQLKQVIRFERVSNALTTAPGLGDFNIVPEASPKRSLPNFSPGMADSTEAAAFRQAAKTHHDYLVQSALLPSQNLTAPTIDLSKTRDALVQSLDPQKTIRARVTKSLGIASTESGTDVLEPILDAPEFPQPMYEALRDISQDFLLPGLEHVPQDTVMLLETNSKFVESFLVGLNSEMNRELLWRDYPTDQRSTYFQQFWDQSSGSGQQDIEPINAWGDRQLGDNVRVREKLVLLIRGELLRRYPNSVIYAVEAEPKNGLLDLSKNEKHPVFRGTLKPDVTFLGFDLELKDAIATPGWFFVIQQQPTEPCFGMDVADFSGPLPPLATWNDLSWRHLVTTQEGLNNLSHVSIKTVLPDIGKGKWSRNSAHQAYITLQRPVRIAIHASQMIKQG